MHVLFKYLYFNPSITIFSPIGPDCYFVLFCLPLFLKNNLRDKFVAEIYHEDYCLEIMIDKITEKNIAFGSHICTHVYHWLSKR